MGHSPKNNQKSEKFLIKCLRYLSLENTQYKPEELLYTNKILNEYKRAHNLL